MNSEYLKPYYEAVQQILQGTAVPELERIRMECNKAYLQTHSPRTKKRITNNFPGGYHPEEMVLTFTAQAENDILQGTTTTEKAYEGFQMPPEQVRNKMRTLAERTIELQKERQKTTS